MESNFVRLFKHKRLYLASGILLIALLSVIGVSVTSAAATTSAAELIFDAVQNTTTAPQSVTLTNVGAGNLDITGATIIGANPTDFTLTNPPGGPITLAPGGTTAFNITFNPALGNIGALDAILQISTDDAGQPTLDVGLFGLSTLGLEGANEPTFQNVVNTLGYAIDVGGTGLILGTGAAPIGDEVLVPLFQKAGAGVVTILPVARYSPSETLPFGFYFPDGTATPPTTTVGVINAAPEHQALFPTLNSGGTTFDPLGAHFGVFVNSVTFGRLTYTEDALNTGPTVHAARIYPLDDRNNVPIPNTFMVAFEDAANGDYQDYVFVLSNVTPAVDDPPLAINDTATTTVNTPIGVNLIANDDPVDSPINPASVVVTAPPAAQGTVVNNGDGTVTFTPAPGFTGVSSFTYTVQDVGGLTSAPATVQVTVNAAPPPPPPPPPAPPAPPPANNNGGVAVASAPAFSLNQVADPPFATPGNTVTFTLTVTNTGAGALNNLTATNGLAQEFEILGTNSSFGVISVNGQAVTLNVSSLAPGQSVNLVVTARIRPGVSGLQFTSNACAQADGAAQQCLQTTVLTVNSLPQTGETPYYRDLIMYTIYGLVILSLSAMMTALWKNSVVLRAQRYEEKIR
jgi:uncharacterized repeat protein (TIGR01451 family)